MRTELPGSDRQYPRPIAERERRLVNQRRGGAPAARETISNDPGTPANYIGLALSGGGIRSATFCLGVCQYLAREKLLSRFDYLSTVSGGGYFGAFLGAWIHRDGMQFVQEQLPKPDAAPVHFLRENGRYIAPRGAGDFGVAAASYLRGWVSILLTVSLLVFALLVGAAAIQELCLHNLTGIWQPGASFWEPGMQIMNGKHHVWFSPWWRVLYPILMVWLLPVNAAFWLIGEKPLRVSPIIWGFLVLMIALPIVAHFQNSQVHMFRHDLRSDAHGLAGIGTLLLATLLWGHQRELPCGFKRRACQSVALMLALVSYDQFNGPFPIGSWPFGSGESPPHRHWEIAQLWESRRFSPASVLRQINHFHGVNLHIDPAQTQILLTSATLIGTAWVLAFGFACYSNNVDLTRRKLTELSALGIWAIVLLSAFAAIDTLGLLLFRHFGHPAGPAATNGSDLIALLLQAGPAAAAALASAQRALKWVSALRNSKSARALPTTTLAFIGAILVGVAGLAVLSFLAHVVADKLGATMMGPAAKVSSGGSQALVLGGIAFGLLAFASLMGHHKTLLNLSSDLQLYAARLTRAYLGASNEVRQRDSSLTNVTQPVKNDDLPYREYHPEAKGGPIHLINATVNETVLGSSNLEQKDRRGFNFVLSPVGLTAGRTGHAVFDDSNQSEPGRPGTVPSANQPLTEKIIAALPSPIRAVVASRWRHTAVIRPIRVPEFHPLDQIQMQDQDQDQAEETPSLAPQKVEMMPLGLWVGISGAAFSTGMGSQGAAGIGFLAGLFNIRLGYWWDSHLGPWHRKPRRLSPMQFVGWAGSMAFPAQSYLFDELLGRFHGPAARSYWNLSDGGHFENTGVYELIRRRVGLIVLCDCGCDDQYAFDDLANLVRKARIDFATEIRFLEAGDLADQLDPKPRRAFGEMSSYQTGPATARALLADLIYPDSPAGRLIVLKPIVREDEPLDVREYKAKHGDFPQESTMDQFFNEAQWESYRCLGELTANAVFAASDAPDSAKWSPRAALISEG